MRSDGERSRGARASGRRILHLLAKDLRTGPRSPVFLFVVGMPVLMTFLMQAVFLTLLDPQPRLGIADLGRSQITANFLALDSMEVTVAPDAATVRRLVEHNDVDAGLVLGPGFDDAVRAGERPALEFFAAGESLAANRLLLALATMDEIRRVEGRPAPVRIVVNDDIGGADPEGGKTDSRNTLPIAQRLVPLLVMYVLVMVGIFFTAFMLVQERERHTLDALLVTPVKIAELLLAKALLSFILVSTMSYLTLLLNGALTAQPLPLLVSLAVAGVFCIEIGLLYGSLAGSAKTLYMLVKTLNIFIVTPVVFYLFPSWPRWIAQLFPTYWVIDPVYRVTLTGASLADVWSEMAVALVLIVVLVVPIVLLGRRMVEKAASS